MLKEQRSIMVVDDIVPSRKEIITLLKTLGFKNFFEATNGKEAIDRLLLQKKDIQLIISDWEMPIMDGISLLRWIRKHPSFSTLPFILVTSKGEKEDIARAAEEDVSAYIIKPVTKQTLMEKLKEVQEEDSPKEKLRRCLEKVNTFIETTKLEEAKRELNNFLAKNNFFKTRILYEKAKIYLYEGSLEKGESIIKEALTENPLFSKGWYLLYDILLKKKEYKRALSVLENLYKINPNSPRVMFLMGKTYLLLGKNLRARDFFYMALKTDPKNNELKQDIWNAYLEQDLVKEVIQEFHHLLYEDLTVETLNNLAVALRKQGMAKEAIEAYKQAMTKAPHNEKILYNLAVAYLNIDRKDLSIRFLEKALEKSPNFSKALALLNKLQTIEE